MMDHVTVDVFEGVDLVVFASAKQDPSLVGWAVPIQPEESWESESHEITKIPTETAPREAKRKGKCAAGLQGSFNK